MQLSGADLSYTWTLTKIDKKLEAQSEHHQ